MPEELRFQQALRDRPAVHRHERRLRPRARPVNRARQAAPCPCRSPRRCTPSASEAATRRACASRSSIAEERVISSALQSSMLPAGRAGEAHRLGHRVQQHLGLEGLGQERKHPPARRRHRLRNRAVRRQDHHRQRRANRGGSHRTAPCRPCPACAGPSPPPAGAPPPAPPAPPPPTPPPSPHSPPPSAASRSAAADPCRRRPAGCGSLVMASPRACRAALLAVEDAPLDRAQRLELLAAAPPRACRAPAGPSRTVARSFANPVALLREAVHLARQALALGELRGQERGKAAGSGAVGDSRSAPAARPRGHRPEAARAATRAWWRGAAGSARWCPGRSSAARWRARFLLGGAARALVTASRRTASTGSSCSSAAQAASASTSTPREALHAATASVPARALRGNVTRKWPPLPAVTTLMRPPCASANSRAMASPRPVPSMRPLGLGAAAEEGVEDRFALLRRHARPGVDDVDHRVAAVARGRSP